MPIAVAQECIFEVCNLARQSLILLFGHTSFNALHGASLPWTHLLPDNGGWLPADTRDPIHGAVRQLANGNLLISLHDGSGSTTIGVNDDALKAYMTQGYHVARDHGLHCLITNGCAPIEEMHAKPTGSVLDARNHRADLLEKLASEWPDMLTFFVNRSQVFRHRYGSPST
jgi:hypothetical protein